VICIVCEYDNGISGYNGGRRTCSTLCREEAQRAKRRRKHLRRSVAYRQRRWARARKRRRDKIMADPSWQAWRARVDARNKIKKKREERRPLYKAQLSLWKAAKKLRNLSKRLHRCSPSHNQRRFSSDPKIRHEFYRLREMQRQRQHPDYYKERYRKEMTPIWALREMGWLDGTVLRTSDQIKATQKRYSIKHREFKIRMARRQLSLDIIATLRSSYLRSNNDGKSKIRKKIIEITQLNSTYISRMMHEQQLPRHHVVIWNDGEGVFVVDSNGVAHRRRSRRFPDVKSEIRREKHRRRNERYRVIRAAFQELMKNEQKTSSLAYRPL
jgi:hypothetical protein